jgi:hypothetical protein
MDVAVTAPLLRGCGDCPASQAADATVPVQDAAVMAGSCRRRAACTHEDQQSPTITHRILLACCLETPMPGHGNVRVEGVTCVLF